MFDLQKQILTKMPNIAILDLYDMKILLEFMKILEMICISGHTKVDECIRSIDGTSCI